MINVIVVDTAENKYKYELIESYLPNHDVNFFSDLTKVKEKLKTKKYKYIFIGNITEFTWLNNYIFEEDATIIFYTENNELALYQRQHHKGYIVPLNSLFYFIQREEV